MAAKGKGREKRRLVSTAVLPNGEDSKYFYTCSVKKGAVKLKIKKYDPRVRKHVIFEEAKMK